jgi:L-ascorbate metabolism protein UlaG (beta-lactamase superfamily)
MSPPLAATRVINACVLLEMGEDTLLTDPYFENHWFMRFTERIGLSAAQLPRLTAILGGHGVFDHWQPSSLRAYPFKDETPVYVATPAMASKARSAGFRHVEVLDWGATRRLSPGMTLEVMPRQTALGMKVNNYVLTTQALRVFVGTEARDLEPLRAYRTTHPRVDVAFSPIDGSAFLGRKLVMTPDDAIAAARILGARVLVPIHYANRSIPLLLRTPGTLDELLRRAASVPEVEVVSLTPGQRWELTPPRGISQPPLAEKPPSLRDGDRFNKEAIEQSSVKAQ